MTQKIIRQFLLVVLFLFVLPFSGNTQSPSTISVNIQCKVADSQNQSPLAGIKIDLVTSSAPAPFASGVTDSSGICLIKADIAPGYYFLRATPKGYRAGIAGMQLNKSGDYLSYIFLTSLSAPNKPPMIDKLVPANNSTFLAGAELRVYIIAHDPEKEALEYQFSIGGAIKQPWSAANSYIWKTAASDTGTVGITCEARDARGASAQKILTCILINPGPEEVLKKIADNYARIRDFKADTIFSSTLNSRPLGDVQYCRYFFMAPDKEKIETFSDNSRSNKNEIIINNGAVVYLLDPVHKTREEVNLPDEAGINAGEINYMDIYYKQADFLSRHSVSRVDAETNFNAAIVCIEAIPHEENNLYSKLKLYIDYNKGIFFKTCLYRDSRLVQTIETTESRQTATGEWVPVKMRKLPVLSAGQLVSTMSYSNLQVNPGLNPEEFNPEKQY